jgi:hypothetical protein
MESDRFGDLLETEKEKRCYILEQSYSNLQPLLSVRPDQTKGVVIRISVVTGKTVC